MWKSIRLSVTNTGFIRKRLGRDRNHGSWVRVGSVSHGAKDREYYVAEPAVAWFEQYFK